jgi:hypothetical protein
MCIPNTIENSFLQKLQKRRISLFSIVFTAAAHSTHFTCYAASWDFALQHAQHMSAKS